MSVLQAAPYSGYAYAYPHRARMVASIRPRPFRGCGPARRATSCSCTFPPHIYVWINAFKRRPEYYLDEDVRRLSVVDPLFAMNLADHPSRGRACATGERVISVDGDGTIRRCHFVQAPIGNLYDPGFEAALVPRPCPKLECRCHIGAVHLSSSGLGEQFGDGLLERIPVTTAR